jgi:hypothetical protein
VIHEFQRLEVILAHRSGEMVKYPESICWLHPLTGSSLQCCFWRFVFTEFGVDASLYLRQIRDGILELSDSSGI